MASMNKSGSMSGKSSKGGAWRPDWWKEEKIDSSWDRVKEAVMRDWEQTKHDFGAGGHELRQNAGDTVKQAAGKEPIPADDGLNPPKVIDELSESELPIGYGYGARSHYPQYTSWNNDVETKLRSEWEQGKVSRWDDVKDKIKYGFEYKH